MACTLCSCRLAHDTNNIGHCLTYKCKSIDKFQTYLAYLPFLSVVVIEHSTPFHCLFLWRPSHRSPVFMLDALSPSLTSDQCVRVVGVKQQNPCAERLKDPLLFASVMLDATIPITPSSQASWSCKHVPDTCCVDFRELNMAAIMEAAVLSLQNGATGHHLCSCLQRGLSPAALASIPKNIFQL